MKKLVLLRGKPTSGKSTAFFNLRKDSRMKEWVFINHPALKNKLGKEKGKKKLFFELVKAMETGKDILTEETSEETLMKYIGKEIKKYDYKIITFQFEVSLETAYKRDIQRAKEKWHPFMGKKLMQDLHKMHEERFDEKGILVNCNKLNKKQVVEFIIKKLY